MRCCELLPELAINSIVLYHRSVLSRLSRITIDPQICHGKPCIRGLRYPVEFILDLLSGGMTEAEILADYEDLARDDLLATYEWAARLSQVKHTHLVEA